MRKTGKSSSASDCPWRTVGSRPALVLLLQETQWKCSGTTGGTACLLMLVPNCRRERARRCSRRRLHRLGHRCVGRRRGVTVRSSKSRHRCIRCCGSTECTDGGIYSRRVGGGIYSRMSDRPRRGQLADAFNTRVLQGPMQSLLLLLELLRALELLLLELRVSLERGRLLMLCNDRRRCDLLMCGVRRWMQTPLMDDMGRMRMLRRLCPTHLVPEILSLIVLHDMALMITFDDTNHENSPLGL